MENAENKAPQAQAAEEGSSQPKRRRKQQRRGAKMVQLSGLMLS